MVCPEKTGVLEIVGAESVGEVPNTTAPLPVSSVIALARFAEDGVARKVATFEPNPETPVDIGRPVASARLKAGVASEPPSESETPPYDTDELVSPALSRVPVRDGVNVWVLPLEVMVIPAVRPLKEPVEVARVCEEPV